MELFRSKKAIKETEKGALGTSFHSFIRGYSARPRLTLTTSTAVI